MTFQNKYICYCATGMALPKWIYLQACMKKALCSWYEGILQMVAVNMLLVIEMGNSAA